MPEVKNKMRYARWVLLLAVLATVVTYSVIVRAENNVPLGADSVTVIQTESSNTSLYPPSTINAEAGNVTELTITGLSQTKSWQGYYGNVSGTIILEDSQGYRFYQWDAAEPQGEIYASPNSTITWTSVTCTDFSNATYMAAWNTFFGMNESDYDNLNSTYTGTGHPTFYVGTLTQNGCPTTYTFVNNATQAVDFPAVLLTSEPEGSIIFTSIIENKSIGVRESIAGFDGGLYDFQLLVAENGQSGNDAVTAYYFWVEIQ